jgi:hypothetical protein
LREEAAQQIVLAMPANRHWKAMLRPIKRTATRWLYYSAIKLRKLARPLGIEFFYYCVRNRSFERVTRHYQRHSEPRALLAGIKEKNLVFTVTAGRTGTLFVQKLLSTLPDTTSLHEPEPAFQRYLRRIHHDPYFAREFLLSYKLPAILSYLTKSYCELSHVFCKGYFEPLLDLGITPNLIILRRPPRPIALSLLERYTIPERSYFGIQFLLSPRYSDVLPLVGWRDMTDYQLLFWHAIEIERRQRAYANLVRQCGGTAFDVTARELNDAGCFFHMAETMCLIDSSCDRAALARQHATVLGTGRHKNRFPLRFKADLDAQEEQVWQAVSVIDPQLRAWIEGHYQDGEKGARGRVDPEVRPDF